MYYSLIDDHARQLVTHAVFQAEHVVGGVPQHSRGAQDLPPELRVREDAEQ